MALDEAGEAPLGHQNGEFSLRLKAYPAPGSTRRPSRLVRGAWNPPTLDKTSNQSTEQQLGPFSDDGRHPRTGTLLPSPGRAFPEIPSVPYYSG